MFDDYAEPGIGDGKIIFAEIARSLKGFRGF